MSTLQLLSRRDSSGARSLLAVDNADLLPADHFEDSLGDHYVLRLGSSGLISVAVHLLPVGFVASKIDLRDERYRELDEDDQDYLSSILLNLLRSGASTEAFTFMRTSARGIYIWSITFRAPDKSRVTLSQNGSLVISTTQRQGRFLGALESVAVKLGLL